MTGCTALRTTLYNTLCTTLSTTPCTTLSTTPCTTLSTTLSTTLCTTQALHCVLHNVLQDARHYAQEVQVLHARVCGSSDVAGTARPAAHSIGISCSNPNLADMPLDFLPLWQSYYFVLDDSVHHPLRYMRLRAADGMPSHEYVRISLEHITQLVLVSDTEMQIVVR